MQTTSVDEFKVCQEQVIKDLLEDKDTRGFGLYFQEYHSKRAEVWAYCYRLKTGINTNMYLEAFHKVLKHIYLEGKKCKRLDKTINAGMKMTRDMIFKRLIKVSKDTMTSKEKNIHASHKRSESITSNSIRALENKKSWIVDSASNKSQEYYIAKVGDMCSSSCLKCSVCKICVHTFTCTCTDNLIKLNICKHIHACAREFYRATNDGYNNNIKDDTEADIFNNNKIYLEDNIVQEKEELLTFIQSSVECKLDKYKNISEKAGLIQNLCISSQLSNEDINLVEKKMDEILNMMNKTENIHFRTTEKVNVKQNIDAQLRLYSTKKKIDK